MVSQSFCARSLYNRVRNRCVHNTGYWDWYSACVVHFILLVRLNLENTFKNQNKRGRVLLNNLDIGIIYHAVIVPQVYG